MMQTWFRYEEVHYAPPIDEWDSPCGEGRIELRLFAFNVAKETPKGVRLDNGRFVRTSARKRYACPTQAEALESFISRKNRQRRILKAQLKSVDTAISLAVEEQKKVDNGISSEAFYNTIEVADIELAELYL
jgi:hypothetical protein